MSRTKVMIATPVYDGKLDIEYMVSVRKLESELAKRGIDSNVCLVRGMVVHRARNLLVSMFVKDASATHLLFIDSDMEFRPEAVLRLLDSGHPFCGVICPTRTLDIEKFFHASRAVDDHKLAFSLAQTYVTTQKLQLRRLEDGRHGYAIENGFIRTQEIGCGITLLHRSVITAVIQSYPELTIKKGREVQYRQHLGEDDVFQLFEPLQRGNLFLGEDLAFCARWIDRCKGEIWALVDEQIGHVGLLKTEGKAYDKLIRTDPRPRT